MIYGAAWQDYFEAGWRGVLPLPPREKTWPPKGFTGYAGTFPSYPDLFAWAEDQPNGNICLRLPENVVGLDVDAYAGKSGGDTLAHAESLWGALPPTVRSTSREDNVSGIRLYRVPASAHLEQGIDFPDKGYGHIEICQFSHRYVVCWPSIHPNGAVYRWLDHDGFCVDAVPRPEDLPELPARWLEALSKKADSVTEQADVAAQFQAMPQGEMTPAVIERMNQAMLDITGGNAASRHDSTLANVLALLRLAEQGHSGVPAALRQLGSVFVLAVTPDRGAEAARLEYERMAFGQRGHDLIASHPSEDPAEAEAELIALAGIQPERLPLAPEEEVDFWDSRHELRVIQQFAYARRCSPWAVLAVVLSRVLATIPPWITLPPIVGGRGSLNMFFALVGKPGAGKDAANDVAKEVYPGPGTGLEDEIYTTNVGSAEGIPHLYMRRDAKKNLEQIRTSVMFWVPEIDTLMGLGARAGSVLMPALRMAYTGSDLSSSYADVSKRLPMQPHSYRLTMVMGVQPSHAGPLIDDADGGFPQRCVWLPATDPDIPDIRPEEPMPLSSMETREWSGMRRSIEVPQIVWETVDAARLANARGLDTDLNGHALFSREKLAVALAVLDRRKNVNEQDWELSGSIMRKSDSVRAEVIEVLNEARHTENIRAGVAQGKRQLATTEVVEKDQLTRIGKRIVQILATRGPMKLTGKDGIRQKFRSAERHLVEEALEVQVIAGTIERNGDQWQAI